MAYTQQHTFTNESLTATLLNNEFAALETAWGGIADALTTDGTEGRVIRASKLTIVDGTNATTIKATLASLWNGDAIAETDNIAKNATTGTHWTVDANGETLTIEASGLTGNCVFAMGVLTKGDIGYGASADVSSSSNDIVVKLRDNKDDSSGALLDMMARVDDDTNAGNFEITILYITSS